MTSIREQAIERIRRDHALMLALIERIKSSCTQIEVVDDCKRCELGQQQVCQGNIEQLIRSFVELTLKHHLIESLYMEDGVPQAHRLAHNQAHLAMAAQMKAIRVVLSDDGNCVVAIEGIDKVLCSLQTHFKDYDEQLEGYLLAPA